MKKSTAHILIWFVGVVATFWLLGQYSISVGDDLGYMFADSSLHKCDGPMITNVWDCFTTQAKHYVSTNGRFIIHAITHFFMAIVGMEVFNIVNALMFGLLWLLVVKFVAPKPDASRHFAYIVSLFMLWTCVPYPGTTMLSLIAFATNYLWTAVAYLAFFMLLKRMNVAQKTFRHNGLLCVACGLISIIIGSLQESYALPISGALFILGVFNVKRINATSITMIIGFFVGTAISLFAPGNWNRVSQGGGISFEKVAQKIEILFHESLIFIVALMLLGVIILFVMNHKKATRFVKYNAFYIIAIIVSLMFASLTFTSSRQLFCPSIFAIIVIGRMLMFLRKNIVLSRLLMTAMGGVLIFIFVEGYLLRKNTYTIHQDVIEQLGGKSRRLVADASNANYNIDNVFIQTFAKWYAPDPLANETLHLLFDGYTKRGLSRMGWENRKSNNVLNILPYPPQIISQQFESQVYSQQITGTNRYKAKTIRLDRKYKSARLPKTVKNANKYNPYRTEQCKKSLQFEKFTHNGHIYFILPSTAPDTIVLKYQNK